MNGKILSLLVLLVGCSTKATAPTATAKATGKSPAWLEAPAAEQKTVPVLKLTWQRPDEAVTGYLLKYGFDRDKLDREVRLSLGDLERDDDPKFGPVYRYRLRDIPEDRPVYVTLQAENPRGLSPPSPVMEIPAG